MNYIGSKRRLAARIMPHIQEAIKTTGFSLYLEPFVGGANVIDKVDAPYRIGADNQRYLVALLSAAGGVEHPWFWGARNRPFVLGTEGIQALHRVFLSISNDPAGFFFVMCLYGTDKQRLPGVIPEGIVCIIVDVHGIRINPFREAVCVKHLCIPYPVRADTYDIGLLHCFFTNSCIFFPHLFLL